jgi:hypothetical protein
LDSLLSAVLSSPLAAPSPHLPLPVKAQLLEGKTHEQRSDFAAQVKTAILQRDGALALALYQNLEMRQVLNDNYSQALMNALCITGHVREALELALSKVSQGQALTKSECFSLVAAFIESNRPDLATQVATASPQHTHTTTPPHHHHTTRSLAHALFPRLCFDSKRVSLFGSPRQPPCTDWHRCRPTWRPRTSKSPPACSSRCAPSIPASRAANTASACTGGLLMRNHRDNAAAGSPRAGGGPLERSLPVFSQHAPGARLSI